MIELLGGVILGLGTASAVLMLLSAWRIPWGVREKYREDFFRGADEIIDWENVSEKHLDHISRMGNELDSRRAQFVVLTAVRELKRAQQRTSIANPYTVDVNPYTVDFTPEQKAKWREMFFSWLIAVASQGSILGLIALIQLIEYLSDDKKKKVVADKAESLISERELTKRAA
jgi:hypothetical protein